MKQKNVRDLYNEIASKYDQNRSKAANDVSELPRILELAGNVNGKEILDLGCGIGKHSKAYLEMGANVTGVDASEEMIKIAKNVCGEKGTFFVANFEEVNFEKNSFDIISASYSIMYSNKIKYLFKKFRSWLKPNGRVIFSIYHPIQYFIKIENFDFSKSKKYWFRLGSYDIEVFNYYHPLGEYIKIFNDNKFELKTLTEITVPKDIKGWPEKKYRIPDGILFEIVKKN